MRLLVLEIFLKYCLNISVLCEFIRQKLTRVKQFHEENGSDKSSYQNQVPSR